MSDPLHRTRRTTEVVFPETLELGATRLRRLRPTDAAAVFESYAADPEVTRWLTFRTLDRVEDAESFCTLMESAWESGQVFTYALLEPGDTVPFGTASARVDDFHVAFGYAMARNRWGRGHATSALTVLVEAALAQPGIFRAWAYCDAENAGSAKVMEKAGLRFEGRLRRWQVAPNLSQDPRDCLVYAKVR